MVIKKYDITYHVAQGVIVNVSGCEERTLELTAKVLENPNAVIRVGSEHTKLIQLVPVRNILAAEFKESGK